MKTTLQEGYPPTMANNHPTIWLIPLSHCSKKPVGIARKEDIPYIKCQVCEILAKQLYQQVQRKKAEITPKKISEYQIIEIAENVCNLKKVEADWILRIDIVEKEDRLELVEHDSEGQCNSECKTIERACQDIMGYSDTDVAEYPYKSKHDIDSLFNYLFKDLSKSCNTKPPPVPKLCKTADENPEIIFLKVNFDENKPMCKSLNVKVLPYFHFYRGAEGQLESLSCLLAKFQKIKDAIRTHNTARCSIGPPNGIGDLLLEPSSAPKDRPAESV